jgi:hypothetical protein
VKRRVRTLDFWICLALAALTIAYLRAWPHDFLQADEGTFLYEAKRVIDGRRDLPRLLRSHHAHLRSPNGG